MLRIVPSVFLAVLSLQAMEIGAEALRRHTVEPFHPALGPTCVESEFDFQANDPRDFLEFLRQRGRFTIQCSHKGWLRAEDIPGLFELLESSEPCGSVNMSISSYFEAGRSSVGQEAAFLIEGFRAGEYPPRLNSTVPPLDDAKKKELRDWWKARHSKGEA